MVVKEMRLSIDGVIDRYLEVMNHLKYHKFHIVTSTHGPYIPKWVREFYNAYSEMVPKRKRHVPSFQQVDCVVVISRKVARNIREINGVLGLSKKIYDHY